MSSRSRFSNGVALAFLVSALLVFVVFHFLAPFGDERRGWGIWLEVGSMVRRRNIFSDPKSMIALASFLTFTLLVVASPFVMSVFKRSRLAWWLATLLAVAATLGFSGVILWRSHATDMGLGRWCLIAVPVLNLVGLLFIRRDARDADIPDGSIGVPPVDR